MADSELELGGPRFGDCPPGIAEFQLGTLPAFGRVASEVPGILSKSLELRVRSQE